MVRFAMLGRRPAVVQFAISVIVVVSGWSASRLPAGERPNVLFIVADDIGYSDLGCYGGEIETPNLDSLAARGLRFTNYYVNNMCWPTRACLLTGLYAKTALPENGNAAGGLHPDATTLPQSLRSAGYTTLMSGKWHLSNRLEPDGPNAPHHRGFDQFYGTIAGASDYFAPGDVQRNGKSMKEQWQDNPDYYYTDAITDNALTFMADRDETKPFFLYVAYTAAHWPLHARPADIARYRGRYAGGWDALREQRHSRMKLLGVVSPYGQLSPRHPEVPAWQDAEDKAWQQRRMEVYAAQITSMDRNIGRIIEHLKQTDQFNDTLIVFQHDNGGCHVEYEASRHGPKPRFTTDGKRQPIRPGNIPGLMPGPQTTFQSYGYGWANASNTPFRRFKRFDHEGGTRSPVIVSWPERIKARRGGGLASRVTHVIDMMPTILEATDVSIGNQQPFDLEGRSFLSVIVGDTAGRPAPRPLFWSHSRGKAVRLGDWKLVRTDRQPWELYNLADDATEMYDRANDWPDKVNELRKLFHAWDARTNLSAKR